MRALIITRSGRDIIDVMNFLVKVGYELSDIVTIMDTRQSIADKWKWMTEVTKCFVYIDPSINQLNFSSEIFTPAQLREMIFASPSNTIINIFIASNESFELLWMYEPSNMYSTKQHIAIKSHLFGQTHAEVVVITGKTDMSRHLHNIYGLYYTDIADYYNLNISFGQTIELMHRFI